MIDFAISNSYWYVTFQGHSVLNDVNCLSDSQTSAVLEENLFNYSKECLEFLFCFFRGEASLSVP